MKHSWEGNVKFTQKGKVFLSSVLGQICAFLQGCLTQQEDESTMGEESQLSQDKYRIQAGIPVPLPWSFLSNIKLLQHLAVYNTRHSGKAHLNMCELETPGNYSDLPFLKNSRDGDWESCHSPLDQTLPQKHSHCGGDADIPWYPYIKMNSSYRFSVPRQCSERPWSHKQEITIYFYLIHSTGLLRKGFIAWLPKCRNYAELVSLEKQ